MALGTGTAPASAATAPASDEGEVVVLRALGLGDLLTGLPALRALARWEPQRRHVLYAPRGLSGLLDLAGGPVDEVVDVDFRRGVGTLPGRAHRPAAAVNLHGRGPQSHESLARLGPRRLIAFDAGGGGADGGPAWRDDEHEIVRWCRLLTAVGIPADPGDLHIDPPAAAAVPAAVGATLVHPGAAAEARRWPVDRWAAVARAERAAGRRVVVTGGPGEVGRARQVAAAAGLGGEDVLAGRTDLEGLAAAVATSARVVCGDTGVAHLASALRRPSVVLFGPTSPARWGPPTTGPHEVLWTGRTGDPHAERPDPGLLDISVADVLDAIARLEARAAAPTRLRD